MPDDSTPAFDRVNFACPHCQAYAHHHHLDVSEVLKRLLYEETSVKSIKRSLEMDMHRGITNERPQALYGVIESLEFFRDTLQEISMKKCHACKKISLWVNQQLEFPKKKKGPEIHRDIPEKIRETYDEARSVFPHSPRAAAALLRTALEEICVDLGEATGSLHQKIENLSRQRNFREPLKKHFDIVRVIGNEALHSTTLSPDDGQEIVEGLFDIIDYIGNRTYGEDARLKRIEKKRKEGKGGAAP